MIKDDIKVALSATLGGFIGAVFAISPNVKISKSWVYIMVGIVVFMGGLRLTDFIFSKIIRNKAL